MEMVKHFQSSQYSKFATFLQDLNNKLEMKLDADKHQIFLQVGLNNLGIKVSYKVILSLFMGMIKHSQSTKSNNFTLSLQYVKEEVMNAVLHADKNQNFYKLDYYF